VGSSRSSRGRTGRPGRPVCPGLAGSLTLQMTRPVPLPRTISTSRLSGYRLLHEETCPPVPARGQAPPQCPVTLSEAPPPTPRPRGDWLDSAGRRAQIPDSPRISGLLLEPVEGLRRSCFAGWFQMAMSCGQGSVVGWHAAGGSVCGSAGASPSQGGGNTGKFRFAGRGSAICNAGGQRGHNAG
jgi:hypothetical protein